MNVLRDEWRDQKHLCVGSAISRIARDHPLQFCRASILAGTVMSKVRCEWANSHPLLIAYHDKEWGVPVHDDRLLFEMLNLEGAQAGLSWLTILKKRASYRKAFDNFSARAIREYTVAKRATLLKNEDIVRNRLKIKAVVANATAFLEVQREVGSFDEYIWKFVAGKPLIGPKRQSALPISALMSKELRKRGFGFVGPTICHAFMQAVGMVNDHSPNCFRA
jgi:DNA-3-methyladenine glycosylase I